MVFLICLFHPLIPSPQAKWLVYQSFTSRQKCFSRLYFKILLFNFMWLNFLIIFRLTLPITPAQVFHGEIGDCTICKDRLWLAIALNQQFMIYVFSFLNFQLLLICFMSLSGDMVFYWLTFNWRITALQCCADFCPTWISLKKTYVPSLLTLPPASHPIPPL